MGASGAPALAAAVMLDLSRVLIAVGRQRDGDGIPPISWKSLFWIGMAYSSIMAALTLFVSCPVAVKV